MAKPSRKQQGTIGRVMHEWKHGELESGTGGRKVKSRRQAVAIALSEAGASRNQGKGENKRRLAKTKAKERRGETAQARKEGKPAQRRTMAAAADKASRRDGGPTKAELMRQAKHRQIPGRSRMRKAELARALGR